MKRILSLFLAITMATTMILSPSLAFGAENEKTEIVQTGSNEMSVSGTDSIGKLISQEISSKQSEHEANNGCNIYGVEITGKKATVAFDTTKDCTVLVAIYDEAGKRMLASGKKEVNEGDRETEISIDTSAMPKYFFLRAFLIDGESLEPLASAYESPNYTKEMVEFLGKTVNDFDSEQVLNFDNDQKNNFAVYDESTRVINKAAGKNIVEEADDTKQRYVISNIDSEISSLKTGDIFAYEYEAGKNLIVKVKSIKISGTTAMIQGQNTVLDEVFEYVKIDTDSTGDNAEVDNSNLESGITYNGKISDSMQAQGIGFETTAGKSLSYSIEKGKITGSLKIKIETKFKVYIERKYKYVELSFNTVTSVDVDAKGKADKGFAVGKVTFRPIPVVEIAITPKVELEFSGAIKFSAKVKKRYGATYDSNYGYKEADGNPTVESILDVEGKAFVGLSFKPAVNVIDEKLLSFYCEIKGGIEIKAAQHLVKAVSSGEDERHDCKFCLDGEIDFKSTVSFGVGLRKNQKIEAKIFDVTAKITDFYYSRDHKKFGLGTCPYIQYKVTVTVRNQNGQTVQGATVNGKVKSNKSGAAVLWLANGKYKIPVTKEGYKSANESITVHDQAVKFKVRLLKVSDAGNSGEVKPTPTDKPDSANGKRVGLIDGKKVKQVSIGGYSSDSRCAAITEDGSLYVWGDNRWGTLGDGTTEDRKLPVKIMDNVRTAGMNYSQSWAIKTDGTLYMWGRGIFVDGERKSCKRPVKIMDDVYSVALDKELGLAAISTNGDLYLWGVSPDSTASTQVLPMKVMSNVKAVDFSYDHASIVTKKGELFIIRINLTYGSELPEVVNTPVKAMDNVEMIDSSFSDEAVLTKNGDLYVIIWENDNITLRGKKRRLMGDVKWVSVSHNGNYILTTANELYYCYRFGSQFQRADAVKLTENVAGGFGREVAGGVLKRDGSLYMWDDYQYMGSGVKLRKILKNIKTFSFSGMENYWEQGESLGVCAAISTEGYLYIWGDNSHGQLGNGTIEQNWTPTKIGTRKSSKATVSAMSMDQSDGSDSVAENVNAAVKKTSSMTVLSQGVNVTTSIKKKTYSKLYPNTLYNFYIMKDRSAKDPLAADNLLYIGQKTTNSKGIVTFSYGAKESCSSAERFVVATPDDDLRYYKPTIKASNYTYTGKTIKPEVKLVIHGKTLKKGKDYTVRYKDNKSIGNAAMILEGKGIYNGSTAVTFNIVPRKTAITLVSSTAKKTMQVKWKKNSQATGYQIYVSKSSKFTSPKKIRVKGTSKLSYKITELASKKKYYVKVRAYKVADEKTYYGKWSDVKTVIIK